MDVAFPTTIAENLFFFHREQLTDIGDMVDQNIRI
jgi:hypothetical protein